MKESYFDNETNTLKITKELLDELLLGCKNVYPSEFFALLTSEKGKAIDSYVIVPLFYQTENSVSYRTDLLPLGFKTLGSVHSHPSGYNVPSNADLHSFAKKGSYHLIIGYTFSYNSVACYNSKGQRIKLSLLE